MERVKTCILLNVPPPPSVAFHNFIFPETGISKTENGNLHQPQAIQDMTYFFIK